MSIKKHILIVEHEAPVRWAVSNILTKAGYGVSGANDEQEAKILMLSADRSGSSYDLLLLDTEALSIEGGNLFNELAGLDYCPPIIAMTGTLDSEQMKIAGDDRCLGVICKPIDENVLQESVSRALAVLSGHDYRPPAPQRTVFMSRKMKE